MSHNRRSIITFLTDFGQQDSYVAEMKGTILSRNPHVRFVDVTHEIPPQNLLQASFILWRSYRYFPAGTIHMVIVDSEVGTKRRLLIARLGNQSFLAPDNGLLTPVVHENKKKSFYTILPKQVASFSSRTFEGRDVLAPCAASLSLGIPPLKLGVRITSIRKLPSWQVLLGGDRLLGAILSRDHFGNLITNIREEDYLRFKGRGKGREVWVRSGRSVIKGLSKTYAEGGRGPLALFGSAGLLELAVRQGDASKILKRRSGDSVQLVYGSG